MRDSHGNTSCRLLLLLPPPCPLPCTCLLLCSMLRTGSKIPAKTRPTPRSGSRAGPGERRGVEWPLNRTPVVVVRCSTGESKLVYLTGKSQPTKLDKQCGLRVRTNTTQNKLQFLATGWPIGAGEAAPPVGHVCAWRGRTQQWVLIGSQGGVQGASRGPEHNASDLCHYICQSWNQDWRNTELMSQNHTHVSSWTY